MQNIERLVDLSGVARIPILAEERNVALYRYRVAVAQAVHIAAVYEVKIVTEVEKLCLAAALGYRGFYRCSARSKIESVNASARKKITLEDAADISAPYCADLFVRAVYCLVPRSFFE